MALQQVHRTEYRGGRFGSPWRRRRMHGVIVAVLIMGFVALAWIWAFHRGAGTAGSDVPVLVADPQPTREKPTDPGGMKVADIDPLQYDMGRSPPRVENILPAPEKPLPQPAPEQRAAATPAPASDVAPASPPPSPPAHSAEAAPAGPPTKPVSDIAPPPIKPAVAKEMPPPAKPQAKPKPAAMRAEPKPKADVKAKPVEPGGYRLQLASLRSAADAREVAAKLKRSYPDVLGAVNFAIMSVNLGDRGTYYRVMAGPMSQGSASQVCGTLRERGAACILAKP